MSAQVHVRRVEPLWDPAWAIPEVPVPESDTHDLAIEYLRTLLLCWAERTQRNVKVARNLGIRWVKREPRYGFDPDLCVLEPPPDPQQPLASLKLWVPGHSAPKLAIEIVSPGHPYKDYVDTPERANACGVSELWVYDPMLVGPKARGGPWLLQTWAQNSDGELNRTYAGSGPAHSPYLDAQLHPQSGNLATEAKLRIAPSPAARDFWPTEREFEQAKLQAQQSEITRLKAELAK